VAAALRHRLLIEQFGRIGDAERGRSKDQQQRSFNNLA
jgi:hypothetical protein